MTIYDSISDILNLSPLSESALQQLQAEFESTKLQVYDPKMHPRFGIPRPDLIEFNKTRTPVWLGKKRPGHSVVMKGRTRPKDVVQRISASLRGKQRTDLHKQNISASKRGSKHPQWGKRGPDTNVFGKTWKQNNISCPHCGKNGGASGMKKWHLDNCKFKVG